MPSTTLARGNALQTFYIGPSLTPAAVATATTAAQTAGVFIADARCSADNTLSIQFGNVTAGSLTPTAGTYIVDVIRFEGPLPTTAG